MRTTRWAICSRSLLAAHRLTTGPAHTTSTGKGNDVRVYLRSLLDAGAQETPAARADQVEAILLHARAAARRRRLQDVVVLTALVVAVALVGFCVGAAA
jgi:hypothetical protein